MGEDSHSSPSRRVRAHARTRQTAWPTLLVLLCDAVLLGATFALARQQNTLCPVLAVLPLVLALTHFYLVVHECAHGAVFVGNGRNALLGHVLGFLILCPFLVRRRSHALHHVWAGHPDNDPTNARALRRLRALSARSLRVLDLLWRCWVPFVALSERVGLWTAPFGLDRHQRCAVRERGAAYVYALNYALVLAYLVWCGALARVAALYAVSWALLLVAEEMFNLPHHLHAPFTRTRLPAAQQGRVTHSCAPGAPWSRFVFLNGGYHAAHHAWPQRPWPELPALHCVLEQQSRPTIVSDELSWSLCQRRRPFASALGPYLTPHPNTAARGST